MMYWMMKPAKPKLGIKLRIMAKMMARMMLLAGPARAMSNVSRLGLSRL